MHFHTALFLVWIRKLSVPGQLGTFEVQNAGAPTVPYVHEATVSKQVVSNTEWQLLQTIFGVIVKSFINSSWL